MTLDDLIDAFNAAGFQKREDARNWNNLMPDKDECDRAGIAAVVRALRDSLYPAEDTDAICSVGEIRFELNEILGEQS